MASGCIASRCMTFNYMASGCVHHDCMASECLHMSELDAIALEWAATVFCIISNIDLLINSVGELKDKDSRLKTSQLIASSPHK